MPLPPVGFPNKPAMFGVIGDFDYMGFRGSAVDGLASIDGAGLPNRPAKSGVSGDFV